MMEEKQALAARGAAPTRGITFLTPSSPSRSLAGGLARHLPPPRSLTPSRRLLSLPIIHSTDKHADPCKNTYTFKHRHISTLTTTLTKHPLPRPTLATIMYPPSGPLTYLSLGLSSRLSTAAPPRSFVFPLSSRGYLSFRPRGNTIHNDYTKIMLPH